MKYLNYFFIFFLFVCNQQIFAFTDQSLTKQKIKYISDIYNNPMKRKNQCYIRSALTISCNDCDYIPKVSNAGEFILHKNQQCQVMHNGTKIIRGCYCEGPDCPWMSEIITTLKGHHEPQEEKAFYEVLKTIPSNGKMLELGSFWAYYSMWFHKSIPNATNYMIEPSKRQLEIGKTNFALNDFKGHFTQAFVGAKTEIPKDSQNARMLSVDNFMRTNNIDFLDIIHSDIQGAEYSMLLGAANTIQSKKVGYFFISTHSDSIHRTCISFLKNHNFIIVAHHFPSESYSVDGLIVARAIYYKGLNKISISKKGR
jgi:hypothetical protein